MRSLAKSFLPMLIALVLLLSAVPNGRAESPSPTPAPRETRQAESTEGETTANHQFAQARPVSIGQGAALVNECSAQRDDEERDREAKQYRLNRLQTIFNGLLALLTLALVAVGVFQAIWVKRTIFGNRAHVTFGRLGFENFEGLLSDGPHKQPTVNFHYVNVGETVAFPSEYAALLKFFDGKAPRKPDYKTPNVCTAGTILSPRGEGDFSERCLLEEGILTPQMIIALREGRAELLFYGVIRYRDVYYSRHETRFCLKWDANRKRFEFGGSRAYQSYS